MAMPMQPEMPGQMPMQYQYPPSYGMPMKPARPGGFLVFIGLLLVAIDYFIGLAYYADIDYNTAGYRMIGIISTIMGGIGWLLVAIGAWQYMSSHK